MIGSEILAYCELRLGIRVEPDHVISAINEALNELGDMGLVYDTCEVLVEDVMVYFALPEDYTHVKKVLVKPSENLYLNWSYIDGRIRFRDAGEYKIIARRMPSLIQQIADSLPVHQLYHNAIKFYALAWLKENNDAEDISVQRLYDRFAQSASNAANTLQKTKSPLSWTVIR